MRAVVVKEFTACKDGETKRTVFDVGDYCEGDLASLMVHQHFALEVATDAEDEGEALATKTTAAKKQGRSITKKRGQ